MRYNDDKFLEKFECDYYEEKTYITQSMVKDFMLDKSYYKAKHIDQTIEKPMTAAMIIGSGVDCIVTESMRQFKNKFLMKAPGTRGQKLQALKDLAKAKGIILMTEGEWNTALAIAKSIKAQPAYKEITTREDGYTVYSQPILTCEDYLIKGKLDFLRYNRKTKHAEIIDIKTASSVNLYKYHYQCRDYNYYMQMGWYRYLANANFDIESIDCYHLAVEKDAKGLYHCQTFKIDDNRMDHEFSRAIDFVRDIRQETEFSPPLISLRECPVIGIEQNVGKIEEETEAPSVDWF